MIYENTQIKLDALIGYFNERKLNLSPVFQRGRAWKLQARQELMKNIVQHRPIPAIFLYKEESDSKYSYNILDGKQRLESILLFIGDQNPKLKISTWKEYIVDHQYRQHEGFSVRVGNNTTKKIPFRKFEDENIRDLREYQLAMIEIKLDDETTLDEVINLFVDINQKGVKVTRLHIVRAMKRDDPLLQSVYALVAEKQPRYQDSLTKVKKGSIYGVLSKLSIVAGGADKTARADRMWGKLMELVLFIRNQNAHGKGADVLKKFIGKNQEAPLTPVERKQLRRVFTFLSDAYSKELAATKLSSDYSHFYIMATSLIAGKLFPPDISDADRDALIEKLTKFGKLLDAKPVAHPGAEETDIEKYIALSSKQTTDAKKRQQRQELFEKVVGTL